MKLIQVSVLVSLLLFVSLLEADQGQIDYAQIDRAQIDWAQIDRAAQGLLEAGAAGLAMALIGKEGPIRSTALGYADLEQKIPMTTGTLMNIASISKTVTATSVMMLVEQGKLELDRDINHYLPFSVENPNHGSVPVTLRHLLTHSSSIVDREEIYFSDTSYHPGSDNPLLLGDFLKAYLGTDGAFYDPGNFAAYAPGTGGAYSNIAVGLAGYIVELVSGLPLNKFSAKHIFTPLGMDHSGWMLSEIETDQHARLYEWDGEQHQAVEWYGLVTWPDGGLRTSVIELSRFYAAMMNKGSLEASRIMQAETVDLMFTPQFAPGQVLAGMDDEEGHRQALIWNYGSTDFGREILGHSGGDPGVATFAYFYRETKPGETKLGEIGTGAILLVNTSSENDEFNLAFKGLIREMLKTALDMGSLPAFTPASQSDEEDPATAAVSSESN